MANHDVQQLQQGVYPQWGKRCCKGLPQASHAACDWDAETCRDPHQPCALVSGTGWLRYRGQGYRFGNITRSLSVAHKGDTLVRKLRERGVTIGV